MTTPNEQQEKKKKRGILVPFFIFSIAANIILAWLWLSERNNTKTVIVMKEQILIEKNNVVADLVKLKDEFNSLETTNDTLNKELEQKRAEIDKLIDEAKKHQNDKYIIAKLRKETETLRSIMKHFVVQIDSLNTLNQTILAEKKKVEKDLTSQISKTNNLEKDKDALLQTVNKGSILKAMTPKAIGLRLKGNTKETEVNKASRVDKIKVSFTLSENRIAKKGYKTVFIHIMAPNGKEVAVSESEENVVEYAGTKGLFAEKKEIEYENEEQSVSILCGSPSGFLPGKYLIDIICEGAIIGQSEITLK
jgi:hypothetical protein